MVVRAEGILRGGHVELLAPVTDLPEGSLVTVELRPRELTLADRQRLAEELASEWADDSSLGLFLMRSRNALRGHSQPEA